MQVLDPSFQTAYLKKVHEADSSKDLFHLYRLREAVGDLIYNARQQHIKEDFEWIRIQIIISQGIKKLLLNEYLPRVLVAYFLKTYF